MYAYDVYVRVCMRACIATIPLESIIVNALPRMTMKSSYSGIGGRGNIRAQDTVGACGISSSLPLSSQLEESEESLNLRWKLVRLADLRGLKGERDPSLAIVDSRVDVREGITGTSKPSARRRSEPECTSAMISVINCSALQQAAVERSLIFIRRLYKVRPSCGSNTYHRFRKGIAFFNLRIK